MSGEERVSIAGREDGLGEAGVGEAGGLTVAEVGPEAARDVLAVVHAGFRARPVLDPPSGATSETVESVAAVLAEHGGLLARGRAGPVGAMLFDSRGALLRMRRVAVRPDAQGSGVAGALVARAEQVAQERGYDGLELGARTELPATLAFWQHLGYTETARDGVMVTMAKALPVHVVARSADETRSLGERLGGVLRAGDLVILAGELGAGKTTFAQGLGAGLGIRGPVTSPTFVIARVHPPLPSAAGPALVHVDAYRLGGLAELDDLDLDTSLDDAVTVVEWGSGLAEGLSESRLEVSIGRSVGELAPSVGEVAALSDEAAEEPRRLVFVPHGPRWIGTGLRAALA